MSREPMRRASILLCSGLCVILAVTMAWAAPSLKVNVNPKEISVGETVQLNVQAVTDGFRRGGGQLVAPALGDWDVVSQMRRTTFDSSQKKRITILDLTLRPLRTGQLTIGAFKMTQGQSEYRSQPVVVTVSGSQQAPPGQMINPTDDSQTSSGSTEEDVPAPDDLVFLEWSVDLDDVWLGQPIEARLYIYFRDGLRVEQFNHGKIDLTGFWNEAAHDDTDRPERTQVGNQLFIRDEIARYTLYPLRAGTLQLPELNTTMSLRRNAFFRRGQSTDVQRTAPARDINVRALPTSGKPASYRGLVVGNTRLIARIDRSRIRANEGVELTIETRISGLLQNVPEIELPDLQDFQVFPSATDTRTRKRGRQSLSIRSQSWLLRPRKGGRLAIPARSLTYFDPKAGVYRKARSKALVVNVSGTPASVAEIPKDATQTSKNVLKLNAIRTEIDRAPGMSSGSRPGWFLGLLFGVPFLFLGGLFAERWATARQANAGSRAARGAGGAALNALNEISGTADVAGGYESVHRIVLQYLTARFEDSFNGKTYAQIGQVAREAGVTEATVTALTELLEALDYARFTRAEDREDLTRTVASARSVIEMVEEGAA